MEMLIKNIFEASLLGSMGIILIILLKKTIFKKYNQAFNYYIWLFIIIRMILPFKIPIYIYQNRYPMKHIPNINTNSTIIDNNLTNSKIIGCIWLIGFLIFLTYNIFSYLNFRYKLNFLTYGISDENIKEIYSKLVLKMNIKRKISLKYCRGISTPLGIGIIKPSILLPKDFHYNNQEIEWILKHELMHYKRYDLIYKKLVMITAAIHWFNPLVYVMRKFTNSDCELSCDEAVLKNSNIEEKKFYATILIDSLRINKNNTLQSNLLTGLQLNSSKNIFKKRLKIILDCKKKKKGIVAVALTAVITISSFISIKAFAEESNKMFLRSLTDTTKVNSNIEKPPDDTSEVLYKGSFKNIPKEFIRSPKQVQDMKDYPNDEVIVVGKK